MIHHILLATDGSTDSAKAEDYALYLARTGRAVLTVVFVADDRLCHYGEVDQLVNETTKKQFIRYVKAEGLDASSKVLQAFSLKAELAGVSYNTSIRFGDPASEIVAEADLKQADLLVIGGGGRSFGFFKRFAGICNRILKNSPCPVLVTTA